jgi:hypothetical protein
MNQTKKNQAYGYAESEQLQTKNGVPDKKRGSSNKSRIKSLLR